MRTNSEAIVGATARSNDADFTDGVAITSSIYPMSSRTLSRCLLPRLGCNGFLAKPLTDGGPGLPGTCGCVCLSRPLDLLRSLISHRVGEKTIILLGHAKTRDNHVASPKRRWWWPLGASLTSGRRTHGEGQKSFLHSVANDGAAGGEKDRRLAG